MIRVTRLPSSPRNSMPSLFMATMVSAEIGTNDDDDDDDDDDLLPLAASIQEPR